MDSVFIVLSHLHFISSKNTLNRERIKTNKKVSRPTPTTKKGNFGRPFFSVFPFYHFIVLTYIDNKTYFDVVYMFNV